MQVARLKGEEPNRVHVWGDRVWERKIIIKKKFRSRSKGSLGRKY